MNILPVEWKVNQTDPPWQATLQKDPPPGSAPGTAGPPYPVTGATQVMLMVADATPNVPVFSPCAGAATITDGPNGVVTYRPQLTDLFIANPGNYLAYWSVTFPSGVGKSSTFQIRTLPA